MNRFVAIFLVLAAAAVAQTNRGSIAGTVTDPSSSVVPGATVNVTNIGTNEVRTTTTAGNGTFSASPTSNQSNTASKFQAQGFKKEVDRPRQGRHRVHRHGERQAGDRLGGYQGHRGSVGGHDRHCSPAR